MANYDTSITAPWNKNDVIRHKLSGHPYLVVHVFKFVCTIIIDLEEKRGLSQTLTLLPRDYDDYTKDSNMEEVKKNDEIALRYNPMLSVL